MLQYFLQGLKPVPDEGRVDHLHNFVHQLLNKETKLLNLSNWHQKSLWRDPEGTELIDLLRIVVQNAPNLEHLSIGCYLRDEELEVKEETLMSIWKLKNLKHLSLIGTWWMTDQDLLELPTKLPNLVNLKVKLY